MMPADTKTTPSKIGWCLPEIPANRERVAVESNTAMCANAELAIEMCIDTVQVS